MCSALPFEDWRPDTLFCNLSLSPEHKRPDLALSISFTFRLLDVAGQSTRTILIPYLRTKGSTLKRKEKKRKFGPKERAYVYSRQTSQTPKQIPQAPIPQNEVIPKPESHSRHSWSQPTAPRYQRPFSSLASLFSPDLFSVVDRIPDTLCQVMQ